MKITANQVTIARILLLPLPCLLILYGNLTAWWWGFVIYTLLGMTDFVDGIMARKEGPTKIGGLLDPVADKIFIASVMIALVSTNFFPTWAICAILGREFLVTALRSSVSLRRESITTSKLAKIKTIFQMGGFGTIFMTFAFPKWLLLSSAFTVASILALIGLWYFLVKSQKIPYWILPVSSAFFFVFILAISVSTQHAILAQLIVMTIFTWLSALDYLAGSYRIFASSGLHRYDLVRALWSILHGICVVSLIASFPQTALFVLVSISAEFCLGGIDNIVAAEKGSTSSWPFIATSLSALLFFIAATLHSMQAISLPLWPFSTLMMLVSLSVLFLSFKKWRFLFRQAFESGW